MESTTIAAVSTPPGSGGIAVVRLSGPSALDILSKCWRGKEPGFFQSHSLHLGWIADSKGEEIDQVVVAIFKAPNSYTGEDVVEISCHGSRWIQQAVVNRLIECGATAASPGEFTQRAFMNGRLDLAQAEGVADLIAASSKAAARLAASQLKGEFSKKLAEMRQALVDLASLLELELDFSEEDVEFADRQKLVTLTDQLLALTGRLAGSFKAGEAFKNGVPVAIAGVPNAGKSTLLNAIVEDDKAIVSDIPGTTRDIIEETAEIDGILFRFFDTAGLRDSEDEIERIGIDRARRKISEAAIVLHLVDPTSSEPQILDTKDYNIVPESKIISIRTKSDLSQSPDTTVSSSHFLSISAKTGEGLDELKKILVDSANSGYNPDTDLIVTNARHYTALTDAMKALERVKEGLENGISADFLAQDIREATHHIGAITGEVTSSDLLHTIFSRYCIGK